jgi:hypothetical protein
MAQFSVREAAAELGVHPARITHWIAIGKIHADWIDGPHGRARGIDTEALNALRRELHAEPDLSSEDNGPSRADVNRDALVRARAVESYTAGLAATAIAPAVSRLVETIEQLTRENGDLREQIGSLKARLDAHASPGDASEVDDDSQGEPSGATPSGLGQQQWDTLRERLDRLSQPLSTPESAPAATAPVLRDPENGARRRRRPSPWERLSAWLREKAT